MTSRAGALRRYGQRTGASVANAFVEWHDVCCPAMHWCCGTDHLSATAGASRTRSLHDSPASPPPAHHDGVESDAAVVASFTHVASSSPPYCGHHDGATMRTTDPTHGVDDKAAGAMPPAVNTPAASAMPLNMGHPGARDPSCRPPLPDSDESASLATACELLHDTFVKWECTLGSRCLWSLMVAAGAMDVRMVHVATQRGVASQYCATMMENCAVFATGKKTAAGHDDRALEAEIGGTMAPPSSGDVVSTWSDQTTPPLLPAAPTLPSGGNFSTQRPTAPSVPLSSHQADRIMTPPLHSSTGGSDQSTLSLPHRASTWTCPLSSSSSSSLLLPSPSTARWTQLPPPTTPATISDAAQPFLIYYRQGSWRQLNRV